MLYTEAERNIIREYNHLCEALEEINDSMMQVGIPNSYRAKLEASFDERREALESLKPYYLRLVNMGLH